MFDCNNYLSKKCVLIKFPTKRTRASIIVALKSVANLNIKNKINPATREYKIAYAID